MLNEPRGGLPKPQLDQKEEEERRIPPPSLQECRIGDGRAAPQASRCQSGLVNSDGDVRGGEKRRGDDDTDGKDEEEEEGEEYQVLDKKVRRIAALLFVYGHAWLVV